jgi:hypothetical protein
VDSRNVFSATTAFAAMKENIFDFIGGGGGGGAELGDVLTSAAF